MSGICRIFIFSESPSFPGHCTGHKCSWARIFSALLSQKVAGGQVAGGKRGIESPYIPGQSTGLKGARGAVGSRDRRGI